MNLVAITEAAAALKLARKTLDRWAADGKIKRFRREGDRKIYVDLDQVREVAGFKEV